MTNSIRVSIIFTIIIFLGCCSIPTNLLAAPTINNITDNRSDYPNNKISRYDKLEINFTIGNSVATDTFQPHTSTPPNGIDAGIGITVDAIFTDPDGQIFKHPGFYYQNFEEKTSNSTWFYPTNDFSWKVRFAPHKTGVWNYKINVIDASGTTTSQTTNFTVAESNSNGFIRVSQNDKRYFEFTDGTYFPALGYNLNSGNIDLENPVGGNTAEFTSMGANGIQLSRIWLSQKSIYGAGWAKWFSQNPAHVTNEALMGLVNFENSELLDYPDSLNPLPPDNSNEYHMWLNFNEDRSPDGTRYRFTPCRYIENVPIKQATYRLRVRFYTDGLTGPRVPGISPDFGLVIKHSDNALWDFSSPDTDHTKQCYYPATGTVLGATYNQSQVTPDPANPGWYILETTYTNTDPNKEFLRYLYLALENVVDPNGENIDANINDRSSGGHAFIDTITVQENLGNGQFGPNIIRKPTMDHHYYINQRDAYSFDKVVNLAHQYGIYLKPVILDKNDDIFSSIDDSGNLSSSKSNDNFYGNFRSVTKVRWLQQAWWRYLQARWGYSSNIHSWELLNEGNDGPRDGRHWTAADEFGKFMHCRVFGINTINDPNEGVVCPKTHPNVHLVTTSFFAGSFPFHFWNNTDDLYGDIDFADQHLYPKEGIDTTFYDTAQNTYDLSVQRGAYKLPDGSHNPTSVKKPYIRGEVGWSFIDTTGNSDLFVQNATNGVWVHNYLWGQLNHGGGMEQYWVGGLTYGRHIYNIDRFGNPLHDHRPQFGNFYRFIKDIPLNNGNYSAINASSNNSDVRIWGQKDVENGRAHAWIQNSAHTWKNVYDQVSIQPENVVFTLSGFSPNTSYILEWWDTSAGAIENTTSTTSNSSGVISLSVNNLTTDKAFRLGEYNTPPPPSGSCTQKGLGDANCDSTINIQDYVILSTTFGSTTDLRADFNGSGNVNIQDYIILSNNFGS